MSFPPPPPGFVPPPSPGMPVGHSPATGSRLAPEGMLWRVFFRYSGPHSLSSHLSEISEMGSDATKTIWGEEKGGLRGHG